MPFNDPPEPPVSAEELEEVAAKFGTPYQLYDETAIRSGAEHLISSMKAEFPEFKQFFAVKALPNPAVLEVLLDEGCGLDCSSTSELWIAKKLGVPGHDVMYTSNYTSKADLAFAFDQGVVINLDDISLVDDLVEVRGRTPELISFRLNPGLGRTDSETKSNVLGGPDAKFGVPPDQIVEAYKKAKAAGSTKFGLHMMTGSCVLNNEYWTETVTKLCTVMVELKNEVGIDEFEFINIGGGLGIHYLPHKKPVDVVDLARCLKSAMSEVLSQFGMKQPKLYMENGRYMTGPHGWLVSRCHVIKKAMGQRYYGLDSCMANLMRPGMYEAYHHITVPCRENSADRQESNVVGTLCENNDWFAKARDLPVSEVGDLFVIHDTGAHSHSMGFQYNGKLRAPELLRRTNGQVDLIRERETIEGLYANCVMPDGVATKARAETVGK